LRETDEIGAWVPGPNIQSRFQSATQSVRHRTLDAAAGGVCGLLVNGALGEVHPESAAAKGPAFAFGLLPIANCCSFGRIVKEELIAVGIIDHQEPIAPRTLLHRHASGLKFPAQGIYCGGRGFARVRLDIE